MQKTIDLSGSWSLKSTDGQINTKMELPGDVFSALIAAGIIPHPYLGRNELDVQWVNQLDWILEKEIEINETEGSLPTFYAEVMDTAARIELNSQLIGESDNMFIPARFPLSKALKKGKNKFRIYLDSAEKTAAGRAQRYPYSVPATTAPVTSDHRNFLRKAQCHAGWDWGPCLMTAGVYQKIEIEFCETRLENVHTELKQDGDLWTVRVQGEIVSGVDRTAELKITLAGAEVCETLNLGEGKNTLDKSLIVKSPELWWPNGEGEQKLYTLDITVGDSHKSLKIGFRTIEVINQEDKTGLSMFFRVNGRDIFAKGANWIPTDALPSGQDHDKMKNLLESSAMVHMNMLRVWGGGQYESEAFYTLCDELGLLIWQDFMFSCSPLSLGSGVSFQRRQGSTTPDPEVEESCLPGSVLRQQRRCRSPHMV